MIDIGLIWAFLNRNLKKPLNVQIEEMRDSLSGYTLQASDELYAESHNEALTTSGSDPIDVPVSFTVKADGSAKISAQIKISNVNYTGYFYYYINGVQKGSFTVNSTSYVTRTATIDINKNDILTFKIKGQGSYKASLAADTLNICCTPIPIAQQNLIELIEG